MHAEPANRYPSSCIYKPAVGRQGSLQSKGAKCLGDAPVSFGVKTDRHHMRLRICHGLELTRQAQWIRGWRCGRGEKEFDAVATTSVIGLRMRSPGREIGEYALGQEAPANGRQQ